MNSPSEPQAPPQGRPHSRSHAIRVWLCEVLDHSVATTRASRVATAAFVVLIILNVAAAVAESVPDLAGRYAATFTVIEAVSLVVFTIEYALRVWIAGTHDAVRGQSGAHGAFAYIRSLNGIVDLLAILPFWISLSTSLDLRVILVFRVFRFLKLARYSVGVRSLLDALYQERGPLLGCLIIFMGATLLAASLITRRQVRG